MRKLRHGGLRGMPTVTQLVGKGKARVPTLAVWLRRLWTVSSTATCMKGGRRIVGRAGRGGVGTERRGQRWQTNRWFCHFTTRGPSLTIHLFSQSLIPGDFKHMELGGGCHLVLCYGDTKVKRTSAPRLPKNLQVGKEIRSTKHWLSYTGEWEEKIQWSEAQIGGSSLQPQ